MKFRIGAYWVRFEYRPRVTWFLWMPTITWHLTEVWGFDQCP